MADQSFRKLTSFEYELAARLLEAPERDNPEVTALRKDLRQQLDGSKARLVPEWQEDNYGSIEFELPADWSHQHYPIAEGRGVDEDGVPIEVLLFEARGKLYMLEIFKADGAAIKRMPAASEFEVWEML